MIPTANTGWKPKPGLRTDFNIEGITLESLPAIKRKSLMKVMYQKAGVETAPGIVVKSASAGKKFAQKVGFPLIAKPDIGVGASQTYRFDNQEQLDVFLSTPPPGGLLSGKIY